MPDAGFGGLGICPLTFNQCPGPQNCAPAVMVARSRDKSGERQEGVDLPSEPLCPISVISESVAHGASGLAVLLMGSPEPEKPEPEETQGQREARIRAEILKKAGYDSEPDAGSGGH